MVKLKIFYSMRIKCYINIMYSKKIYQKSLNYLNFTGNDLISFFTGISINPYYNKHILVNIKYNHNLV